MDVARLVLAYIEALVWPVAIFFVLWRFRAPLSQLIIRIAGQSNELSASVLGVSIVAKFREEITDLAEQASTADSETLRESVKEVAREFGREEFRTLARGFYTNLSVPERQAVARELKAASAALGLDDILEFADARDPGSRVGAAIALGARMQSSKSARTDPRVHAALHQLLSDGRSRVRYRAVEALRRAPELIPAFADELGRLAEADSNPDVQGIASRALRSVGKPSSGL